MLFAFTPVDLQNIFHKNLLISVYILISGLQYLEFSDELLHQLSYISNYEKDLEFKFSLLGLLNFLFLDSYFSESLEKVIFFSNQNNLSLLPIVFRLTKLIIKSLREKRLNNLIKLTNKCLELIFFTFAGVFLYFFSLLQMENNTEEVYKKVKKNSKNNLENILAIAKDTYNLINKSSI